MVQMTGILHRLIFMAFYSNQIHTRPKVFLTNQ